MARGMGVWAAGYDGPMTLVWTEETAGPTGTGQHSEAVAKTGKHQTNILMLKPFLTVI